MPRILIPLILAPLLFGCASIPENAALLNQRVSDGIQRNQTETDAIVTALADVERAMLDRHWDELYQRIETAYLAKHNIADPAALDHDQRRAIAATAADAYSRIQDAIEAKEVELLTRTRANTQTLVDLNGEISKYLASVHDLDTAQAAIAQHLGELTGIDIQELLGIARDIIDSL